MTTLSSTYVVSDGTKTVTISVAGDSGSLTGEASPVAIPHGKWNVVWTLEDSALSFSSIDLPTDPLKSENVQITNQGGGGSEWTAFLENHVTTVNSFNYTISLESGSAKWSFDPTIAVTPDPPPGG
jgi:hypothetical protein